MNLTVVIQLHDDGDCRTDMYGNASKSETRFATLEEIKTHRPELLEELIISLGDEVRRIGFCERMGCKRIG